MSNVSYCLTDLILRSFFTGVLKIWIIDLCKISQDVCERDCCKNCFRLNIETEADFSFEVCDTMVIKLFYMSLHIPKIRHSVEI